MKSSSAYFLLFLFPFLQCQPNKTFNITFLQGFWQSLNDQGHAVAFKEDGCFANYSNEKDLLTNLYEWDVIHYKVHRVIDNNRAELIFFDATTKKLLMRAEVHRVNRHRIRMLFLKHNHILDVADEYYKTDGFGNFDAIMASFDIKHW